MTYAEYQAKREFLTAVLQDAKDRGDIYLEYDTIELLEELNSTYFEG